MELVQKLKEVVDFQFREVRRSFVGLGDFELCPEFEKFELPQDNWFSKTAISAKEKKRQVTVKRAGVVCSTQGRDAQ